MNNEIIKMPVVIDKSMYFKKDEYKVIYEEDIFSDINKDIETYFNNKEDFYRKDIINNKTRGLKELFMTNKLKEYINSSYLINIKNESEEKEDKANEAILNKIIRRVKKDRKNDYSEVLEKISNIINDDKLLKDSLVKEYDDMTIDEELVEAIKNEDKKEDKLTKYIKETVRELYNSCFTLYKNEYDNYYNNFVEGCKEEIDNEVSSLISNFKKNEEKKYREDRQNNLVNLYDYVFNNYSDKIKWIDICNHIILLSSFTIVDDDFNFVSGTICPSYFKIRTKYNTKLYRNGDTFTLLFEGVNYEDIEKSYNRPNA